MGAIFSKTDQWQGEIGGGYETATAVANKPAPDAGKVWRRKRLKANRWRTGKGILSFGTDAGNIIDGSQIKFQNGDSIGEGHAEDKYLVTDNSLKPDPPGSGIWRETHTAETFDDWEQWDTSGSEG
ncbi:MAG: hypothetical protein GY820_39755 [Gammaproteobacteria bacterium]|nr:hypothetical protein [Gammaproteobacteria bacterium]